MNDQKASFTEALFTNFGMAEMLTLKVDVPQAV